MSPVPSVTFRSELPSVVRKELDQHDSELSGFLLQEHDDDGHHTHITAQSISVDTLVVTGGITAPGLEGGDDLVGASLTVNGPSELNGATDLNGPVTADSLTVGPGQLTANGPSVFNGHASLSTLEVAGTTTLNGTTNANGPFNANVATIVDLTVPSLRPTNVVASGYITAALQIHSATEVKGATVVATASIRAGSDLYEKARTVPMGHWQPVAFNAANFFGAGSLIWTVSAGNVGLNRYTLIGKTLTWALWLNAMSLSGTPNTLIHLTLPDGLTTATTGSAASVGVTQLYDGGGFTRAIAYGNGSLVNIQKDPSANFALTSGGMYLLLTITLEIN